MIEVEDANGLAAGVGARVRAVRGERGLSAVVLARQAGISQPFLSQIERGHAAPSLTTLYALARSLDVSIGRLLTQAESADGGLEPLVRASEGIEQFARVLVSSEGPPQVEALEHEFTPGEGDRDWFHHEGQDLLYVIEGIVELQRRDHPNEILRAGSARLYDGETPHRCVLHGEQPARTLLVAIRP